MMTPSFSIGSIERVLPSLALDWTTGLAQTDVNVTRAGVATFVGSNGLIQSATADTQRIDYSTGLSGLLIEESRSNILLDSLIDGTSLATQTVTVSAVGNSLSFYGAGSVVLSGAATATVNGVGAYPSRTTFTFTPTSGSLTLTVSGTVQFAQLEVGSFATSFIPTEAASVTRNADIATMTDLSWLNTTAGTIQAQANSFGLNGTAGANRRYLWSLNKDLSISDDIFASYAITTGCAALARNSGGSFVTYPAIGGALVSGDDLNLVTSFDATNIDRALNATADSTRTLSLTLSNMNRLAFGRQGDADRFFNGYLRKFYYWPMKLTNPEVQAFSK